MLQDEYYIIERENNDNYPLFSWDQKSTLVKKNTTKPLSIDEPFKLRLGEPIPPNPKYVDYHTAPEPFVSQKISNSLESIGVYGVQFLPAVVRDPKDLFGTHNYQLMHVWNRISCLDRENSDLELFDDGDIFSIDELKLDESTLKIFELDKRSIFYLSEKPSVLLVHQSIKDAIMSANPIGCRFFKATEWNSDSSFS